ncbi:MAG TPA: prolipoprotein diacylglyceryl transferase [Candidatus Acidoferrales bacterium]|nr:prolipoprotein diacylglyceryl transferase [Candidatus Acidoferrales bacterium]
MHPLLFRIGSLPIHSYGTLLAFGILLALWLAQRRAPAAGLDSDSVWNLGVYMILAALAGAKVWLIFADWSYYQQHPGDIFSWNTLQAGGVWYGGLLTAAVVLFFYARHAKLPFVKLGDVYAAPLALGHAIGRLGCFCAGCCYGKPTTMPWGVVFTSTYAHDLVGTPLGVPLHPTQLYESIWEAANVLILFRLGLGKRPSGQVLGAYAFLYGLTRGTVEFFRGDPGRTQLGGSDFSIMHIVSLVLILFGAWMWFRPRFGMARPAPSSPGPATA